MQDQHASGRCDFIDVLEEAQVAKHAVVVELRDGRRFTARVRDVVTESHEDFVIFEGEERIAVTDIRGCERATELNAHSYDDKL